MTERLHLAAGHVPDLLVLVLLTGAVLLALAEGVAAYGRSRATTPRRISAGLLALRLGALFALLAVAFELTLRIEQVTPAGRRLVVLVDRSASVALADAKDEDDTPQTRQARLEQAWQQSADARVGWRDDGLVVDVRGFSLQTTPITGAEAETLAGEPNGGGSDLARALSELAQPDPERAPLAAVVVISDGLVAQDDATDARVSEVGTALGVPITTLSLGAPFIRDASVAEVRAGEFAFVENVTELEAIVVAHGLRGTATQVELRRDGEVVATKSIRLGADGEPTSVRFEVAPDRVGQFVYELTVPPQPREATVANNSRAFVVKVLRDKVRVLHVAGRPDWDVRALRTLLRRDPNVELLSYYILRGLDDIGRQDTTAELSLIPFPTDELFEEELGSFDLVIFHNFDPVIHQVEQYLDNIGRYVEEGGALVLIGGDLAFTDGGYGLPELAGMLPVDTRRRSPLERGVLRPTLTEAGRRHPITAWLTTADEGWAQLPALDDYNPLPLSPRGDMIGTAALLVHHDGAAGGTERPILAVSEPGRGRVMVLATGSTWRLGFAPDLPLIDGARPYDLLWLGAVRWLLRDDTSGRLALETDRPRVMVGEPVELQAKTWSASYAAEPNVVVDWSLHPLTTADQSPTQPLREGQWVTDGLGRASESLADLPVGAYVARARRTLTAGASEPAPLDTDALGQHEVRRVFIVEPPGLELARVDADPGMARLLRLAEATGGEALVAADDDALPRRIPLREPTNAHAGLRVDARRDIPLWNGWLALMLLVATFGGEWLLRRRQGEV